MSSLGSTTAWLVPLLVLLLAVVSVPVRILDNDELGMVRDGEVVFQFDE